MKVRKKSKSSTSPVKKVRGKKEKYYLGTGRRKSAVARVRLYPGKGKFLINDRGSEQYFPIFSLRKIISAPLKHVNLESKFDIKVKVSGGGIKAQAEAISLGVARALLKHDKDLKKTLKDAGFLTRDPRKKERKKPGLRRARRAPQWRKR